MEENPHGLKQIHFRSSGEQLWLRLEYGDLRDNTLPFSFTDPVQETYIVNYVLYFEENRLALEFDINVSLDIPVYKVKGELLAEFAAPSER